jgi:hypothetical protein
MSSAETPRISVEQSCDLLRQRSEIREGIWNSRGLATLESTQISRLELAQAHLTWETAVLRPPAS